ncbi:MAG TPA: alpha/beta hydrolase [Acetobacteraceae bacterium]|nr:alpha/beta hydrolase [Acetobacteraceae bacterium]
MADATVSTDRHVVGDISLEILRCGVGQPILALHGMQPIDPAGRFLSLLGRCTEIIAPSHPGFGDSPRPADFDTVYDLAHLYLELLDSLPHNKVTLLGFSFGGWLAAEMAAACCHRIDKLILVDPFGIKLSDRETPDILDVFNTHPDTVRAHGWHDPDRFAPDFNAMTDTALVRYARGRDALCLYGFQPYMYNPQLKRWLSRIAVPTLVLWGASDRIVTPEYGRCYAGLIPGARFAVIDAAGHHPEMEQPETFIDHVTAFIGGGE